MGSPSGAGTIECIQTPPRRPQSVPLGRLQGAWDRFERSERVGVSSAACPGGPPRHCISEPRTKRPAGPCALSGAHVECPELPNTLALNIRRHVNTAKYFSSITIFILGTIQLMLISNSRTRINQNLDTIVGNTNRVGAEPLFKFLCSRFGDRTLVSRAIRTQAYSQESNTDYVHDYHEYDGTSYAASSASTN